MAWWGASWPLLPTLLPRGLHQEELDGWGMWQYGGEERCTQNFVKET